MMTVRIILIGSILCSCLVSVGYPAEKEIQLIADNAEGQAQMCADVFRDTVIVGVHSHVGLAKIYERNGEEWEETLDLVVKDGDMDNFGYSVAINGPLGRGSANIAIVGAPQHDGAAKDSGAAYIFTKSGRDWKQRAKLAPLDGGAADNLGHAVSVDRNTAVVGAPKSDAVNNNSGAVYVFVLDGSWKQQAKLAPKDLGRSDAFGYVVFVRKDTIVVGAPGHTHSGIRFAGAAYVFVRQGEKWVEQVKLTADDAAQSDRFGHSVALSGDTIVVGAPLHDTDRGADTGAAYIFSLEGGTWKQQAKLGIKGARKADQLGFGVATNGKVVVLGAKARDEGDRASGAAYAFVGSGGVWEEKNQVVPLFPIKDGFFGFWVAISENTVVVSAHPKAKGGPGLADGAAAFVYSTIDDFGTPPFGVDPIGLHATTLGQIKRTALLQNYPNPFNPETWFPYVLAKDVPVSIRIWDVRGQLINELALGEQKAGSYLTRDTAAYWDGLNLSGSVVSTGVYFYTLDAGHFQATRRMLILK